MQAVTITQITPPELETLIENSIRKILSSQVVRSQQQADRWFDLNEPCSYLPEKPAKPTVYGWVSSSVIPYHKRAKKLFFLKSEIDKWLTTGRKQTAAEIASEADAFLLNIKKPR